MIDTSSDFILKISSYIEKKYWNKLKILNTAQKKMFSNFNEFNFNEFANK